MANRLVDAGVCLDIELCRSGGYLYSMFGPSADSKKSAGGFLQKRGYRALAELVGGEKEHGGAPETICEEKTLVFLASKLFLAGRSVPSKGHGQKLSASFESHDSSAAGRFPVKEVSLREEKICERLLKEFEVMIGERL